MRLGSDRQEFLDLAGAAGQCLSHHKQQVCVFYTLGMEQPGAVAAVLQDIEGVGGVGEVKLAVNRHTAAAPFTVCTLSPDVCGEPAAVHDSIQELLQNRPRGCRRPPG